VQRRKQPRRSSAVVPTADPEPLRCSSQLAGSGRSRCLQVPSCTAMPPCHYAYIQSLAGAGKPGGIRRFNLRTGREDLQVPFGTTMDPEGHRPRAGGRRFARLRLHRQQRQHRQAQPGRRSQLSLMLYPPTRSLGRAKMDPVLLRQEGQDNVRWLPA
jgi:hypothetical protein